MADKPKPEGKGMPTDSEAIEQVIFILAVLMILGAIATAITGYLNDVGAGAYSEGLLNTIREYFMAKIWPVWKVVAVVVSVSAAVGIIYNLKQLEAINIEELKIFSPPTPVPDASGELVANKNKNDKWERVLKLANSNSEADWRLAILEADIILDELLRNFGFVGDSIGDMLKTAEKSDFTTIDEAWDAHKVRNQVAHGGKDFQLNERETKRVIALYEQVFKEFEII